MDRATHNAQMASQELRMMAESSAICARLTKERDEARRRADLFLAALQEISLLDNVRDERKRSVGDVMFEKWNQCTEIAKAAIAKDESREQGN